MSYTNPILALPAMERVATLPVEARSALAAILRDLGDDCAQRAEKSWTQNKAPMAAYWKSAGVYARHIARAIEGCRL